MFGHELFSEASSFNYLGMIISNDLLLADHINYTVRKLWEGTRFIMRIIKVRKSNTKPLAYTALVRPIFEYGAVCSEPYTATKKINQLQ